MKLNGLHIVATALVGVMLAFNGATLVKHYCERHGGSVTAFSSGADCLCDHNANRVEHDCKDGGCDVNDANAYAAETIGGPACCANKLVSIAFEPFVKDVAPKPNVVLAPLFAVVVVSETDDERADSFRAADRAPPPTYGKEFLISTHSLKIPPEIA
jgi:hypothetical protein